MKCKKCGIDMIIDGVNVEVAGDESIDEETRVYEVQSLKCVNPKCSDYNKKAGEVRHLIYRG